MYTNLLLECFVWWLWFLSWAGHLRWGGWPLRQCRLLCTESWSQSCWRSPGTHRTQTVCRSRPMGRSETSSKKPGTYLYSEPGCRLNSSPPSCGKFPLKVECVFSLDSNRSRFTSWPDWIWTILLRRYSQLSNKSTTTPKAPRKW